MNDLLNRKFEELRDSPMEFMVSFTGGHFIEIFCSIHETLINMGSLEQKVFPSFEEIWL